MRKVHLPENVRLPKNVSLFMPLHQQAIVRYPDYWGEYKEVTDRLDKEIEEIPFRGQSFSEEQIRENGTLNDCLLVYAHFFYAGCDWFILDWDREEGILFCYAILNGDTQMSELGSIFLSDLTADGRIELDFYWDRCSLAGALYDKYSGDFPEPHNKKNKE